MNMAVVPKMLTNESKSLESRLVSREAKIAIIGLGYVGLPLAVSLAEANFGITGIDLNDTKVESVTAGHSYISDIDDSRLGGVTGDKRLVATKDFQILGSMDVVIICVPTPITQSKSPDLSYVISATKEAAKHIRAGQLVVLESTTHPGTTEEVVLPLLEKSGLVVGEDFFLAFSPERVDPGNKNYSLKNTPKVVGGVTQRCGAMAALLYGSVADKVHLVSSPKVAETTKLFENVFRNVNLALVNELTILCRKMGISACEVVEAAATKPFGFMRFNPGPGVGGHCIPVDPYYLAAKAKEYDFHSKFIESAGAVNENMPYFVVNEISEALNQRGKPTKRSRVLILGVAYKKDIDDVRETPAVRVIKALKERGAIVTYNDPYVPNFKVNGWSLESKPLSKSLLTESDCVVIITDHSCYDYLDIVRHSQLVIDTRCATSSIKNHRNKIIRF
jgi:UDP-N-acetyl-D-glucosamine dehydrogenase